MKTKGINPVKTDMQAFNLKLLSEIHVHDKIPESFERLYRRLDRVTLHRDIDFNVMAEALEMTQRFNGSRPGYFLMSAEHTENIFRLPEYENLLDVSEDETNRPGQIGLFLGMNLFTECSLVKPLRRLHRVSLMFPLETMSAQ